MYKFSSIKYIHKTREYLRSLGPGLVTGAADDDPSGIATYSQVGARFGLQYVWLALFTLPLLIGIQEMCGRIGLATRHGIIWHIRRIFPSWVLYFAVAALFIANIFNISADLRAMSDAFSLIVPSTPINLMIPIFALTTIILEIAMPYRIYAHYLKIITLSLLAYIIASFFAVSDWTAVIRSLIFPTMASDVDGFVMIAAVLGTTISPYLFFWQTSTEIEEEKYKIKESHRALDVTFENKELKVMRRDIYSGMIASNLVMFFIMVTAGSTLHVNGITEISSAVQASEALRPLAGNFASLLFALGIIGTGMLALPVLAGSAAYAVSELFDWKEGLNLGIHNGRAFYFIIILAIILGVIINIFDGSAFQGLIYAALLNAVAVPVILFCIVRIASDRQIMGRFTNNRYQTTLGYLAVIIMLVASSLAVYYFALH